MSITVQKALKDYKDIRRKLLAYQYAQFVSSWNMQTEAMPGSMGCMSEQQSVLSELSYDLMTSKKFRNAVDTLFAHKDELDEVTAHETEVVAKQINQQLKIPKKQLMAYNKLTNDAYPVYVEAKRTNNYKLFLPYLDKIISFNRKMIDWLSTDTLQGYDVLADMYESGYGVKQYDAFFNLLRKELVPFVQQITSTQLHFNDRFGALTYDVDKQRQFCQYMRDVMCFDSNRGVMKESEHPFTSGFDTNMVNITTHYYAEHFEYALFSAIHETGHALYQQQCNPALNGTFCADGASMGMHESQSRFYENIIGRSKAFWQAHIDQWRKLFPEQSQGVSLDDFYKFINRAECSFVRTEADELTYSLHIMLRYEMEQKFVDGTLSAKQARDYWNDAFKRYFGITPPNDTLGILQDVHWAGGSIGYFPTYALGSAIGAQLFNAMNKDFDVYQSLASGTTQAVNDWLKTHVHQYGASKYPAEILSIATGGEAFDANYYVQYLKDKYTKLYKQQ